MPQRLSWSSRTAARRMAATPAVARSWRHLAFLLMLLERGAPAGQCGLGGESALEAAVRGSHEKVALQLLQHGAWTAEARRAAVRSQAQERKLALVLEAVGTEASADSEEPPPLLDQTRSAALGTSGALCSPVTARSLFLATLDGKPDPVRGTLRGSAALPAPAAAASWRELGAAPAQLRGQLERAVRKGDVGALRALVLSGAPLDAVYDLGYGHRGNCVDWACVSEQPLAAVRLLELADELGVGDALAVGARAGLAWAALHGFERVVAELLRRGADPQGAPCGHAGAGSSCQCGGLGRAACRPWAGGSPLALAVTGGWAGAARVLLQYGAWEKEPPESREQLLRLAGAGGGDGGALAASLATAVKGAAAAAAAAAAACGGAADTA